MKLLTYFFEWDSLEARAVFEQLPQWLQGVSVVWRYLPLSGAAPTPAARCLRHLAMTCQPLGTSPNRWVCEQLWRLDLSLPLADLQHLAEPLLAQLPSRRALASTEQTQAAQAWATQLAQACAVERLPALVVEGRVAHGQVDIQRMALGLCHRADGA